MTRFCPPCGAEVEVHEGHCLLGHSVEVAASTGSLADLRAQVEQVFDDATVQVSVPTPMPPDPDPAPISRQPVTVTAGSTAAPAPTSRMTPATGPTAGPPPPPAPPRPSAPDPSDPITAFAPPPRMDWGPRRTFLRRKPQEF